jgi:hypothetical protein
MIDLACSTLSGGTQTTIMKCGDVEAGERRAKENGARIER